jgi:hypothetical protein
LVPFFCLSETGSKQTLADLAPGLKCSYYMKNYLLIFTVVIFTALSAQAQSFETRFFADLAAAPYRTIDIFSQTDPTFLVASRDILDTQMEFREASASPQLQAFIDKTMVRIFTSETGKSFCIIYGTNEMDLTQQLAVSFSAARRISQRCAQAYPNVRLLSGFKAMTKKFFFVTNIPATAPFYSWTSWTNDSFIFLEEQLSEEELTARIIHELAVASDSKIMVASSTIETLAGHYGFKMKNGFMNMGSQEAISETIGAMPFPAMKFAALVIRAMVLETMIIEEVFGKAGYYKLKNQEMFSLMKSGKYAQALREMAKTMLPLQDYLLPIEFSIVPPRERRATSQAMGENYYLNEKAIDMIVDNIEKSKIIFEAEDGTTRLLVWLLTPASGPEGSFHSRGPRPRIGPGWSKNPADRSDILKNDKAKSLSQGARK